MWEPATTHSESRSTPKTEAGLSTRGGPPSAKKDYFIKGNSSKHYLVLTNTISSYSASSNCHFPPLWSVPVQALDYSIGLAMQRPNMLNRYSDKECVD